MFRHDPGLTTIRAPRRSNRPATGDADADRTRNLSHGFEQALRLPERPRSRWHRGGVSRRTERVLNGIFATVLLTFAVGWTWSIAEARASGGPLDDETTPATAAIGAALTDPDAPTIAYLTDATVELFAPLRGESGRLRAVVGKSGEPIAADSLPTGASIITYPTAGDARDSARIDSLRGDTARTIQSLGATLESLAVDSARVPLAPEESGVWSTAIRVGNVLKQVTDFSVITLTPISERRRGRIGLYYIGTWPTERGRRRPGYLTPSGFIEVTPESQDTPVSDHFTLGDFLTHDQQDVWPKYLVLDLRLVDKLELVLQDLEERGYSTAGVQVMSGFRTPQYNVSGGDPRGRASLSRHMYGDASDIFLDNDGNGWMDDLNRDGKLNIKDAEVILAAVDRVEREHPGLVGGAGVYPAESGHGPFIHIDVRGYRARWVGTGE
ncbi:MAG TPA: hypothetical protein VFW03_16485 [Gemmatimonadaceae bacterium]|nr:hypothetical protein [Gemmatimonadaceae bacterium]